ncbi:unnamed protein product [Trichobilharzia regenti]|nr:unnamed protein product [Trichobilharzia regenti]
MGGGFGGHTWFNEVQMRMPIVPVTFEIPNLVGNEEDVDDRGDGDGVEGVHTPDDYTGYNLSNYQVMPQNDSLSYDQHCQQEHQQQQHQHQSDDNNPVSFFISDEDDDDS